MVYHFNEFLCKLTSFYYRLIAESNIQVLLKDLHTKLFNNSSLLISQVFHSSHFIYFVYNYATSYDIMAALSLLKFWINFQAFDSKFSIFVFLSICDN